MRVVRFLSLLFLLVVVAAACSKKTSLSHIAYHDLTARYNRYFNSKMIFIETEQFFEESIRADYSQILPLYVSPTQEQAQSVFPNMDEVIKKASANIQLHENSKWTDDAYLHIGIANFYKQDYVEALKAFVYVTSEYDDGLREFERPKRGKKKSRSREQRERDRNTNEYYEDGITFAKHKPARYEAVIWVIRCYTALGEWDKAQSVISLARGDRKFPDPLQRDLAIAATDYLIKRKDYVNAITSLQQAILLTEDKREKTRLTFILAQLHEAANLRQMAIQYFREVVQEKPDFEMEFQALIKIARISKEENMSSDAEIISMLNDMLKDDRYRNFKGELYFTLAEIYLKKGDTDLAIANFSSCIRESSELPDQMAAAYMALANLYYSRASYEQSQAYHDSTIVVMKNSHPDYDMLVERNIILQELVVNLETIRTEDSLQYLASLSEEDLQQFIADQEKQLRLSSREEENQPEEEGFEELMPGQTTGTSSWPFDDVAMRSRGYNEFIRLWGERNRTDFWRIGSKAAALLTQENGTQDPEAAAGEGSGENGEAAFVLGELPKSPEALAASNDRLINAYFALGNIYKDKLDNPAEAIVAFETLLARFPDNRYRLESLYSLYLLHKDVNMAKAASYRQQIIDDFPNSLIAKVLIDPNYIEDAKAQEREITAYYATTYEYFTNDDLVTALKRKKQADQQYPDNFLQPKFDMLEALIYGRMGNLDTCKTALQKIVNKYPFDEVKNKATELLNLLEGRDYSATSGAGAGYTYEPAVKHFFVVLIKNPELDISTLQTRIAQFNDKYFSLESFTMTPVLLNNDLSLVLLKEFQNAAKAKTFYNSIRYNQEVYAGMAEEDYEVFYISQQNYGIFFRQKDIEGYRAFFTREYLNQ